jgi:isoleucyl-tRNA synthetase
MSNFYLDVLKDRLYTFKKDSFERRSAQTVIYNIVVSIAKLIAPILPFTAEEVWRYIPSKKNNDSIHLTEFPEFNEAYNDTELAKRWNILLDVREDVKKALEISRNNRVIGSSLDALIDIKVEGEIFELLNRYKDELKTIFIVSEVRLNNDVKGDIYESLTISGLKIKVTRAPGKKCERCWNYSTTVGENRIFPSICDRCIKVLKEN